MDGAILAVDVGTTSCRALLFTASGSLVARAQAPLTLTRPAPGREEQSVDAVLDACNGIMRQAAAAARESGHPVLAVALGTYMHSLVLAGAGGQWLTPVILWSDTRSAAQAERVRAADPARRLYADTGCPPHPMYPLYKLRWFQEQGSPELDRARVASVKDLLIESLTGEWVLDHAVATATGLCALGDLDWHPDALAWAGITRTQLPPLVPPTTTLPLSADAAGRIGLPAGTPVVVGAGDGMLANIGVGAIRPGICAITVGTSAAVRTIHGSPAIDPAGRTWCYHLLPGQWVVGGALNNGGNVLDWLEAMYGPAGGHTAWIERAAGVPPGAGGLLFLPFLAGERSPGWNARARGVLLGLGMEHGPAHVARAALEGIAFRLRSVVGAVAELSGPLTEIRASGGLSRSPLWGQILADVLDRDVMVPAEVEGSAYGAFALGRLALGLAPDLNGAVDRVRIEHLYRPGPAARRYAAAYDVYLHACTALTGTFPALAALREEET